MIEKRFRLTNPKNSFQEMKCGINDRNKTLTFNETVDCLNNLHEENEIFRTFIELNDFDADEILLQGKGLE